MIIIAIIAFMIIIGLIGLSFDVSILGAIFILLGMLVFMILTLLLAGIIKKKAQAYSKNIDKLIMVVSAFLIIIGLGMCVYGYSGNFGYELSNYTDTKGENVYYLKEVTPAFAYMGILLIIIGVFFFIVFRASSKEPENSTSTIHNNRKTPNNTNNFTPRSNDITAYCFEYNETFVTLNIETDCLRYKNNSNDTDEEKIILYQNLFDITYELQNDHNSITIFYTNDLITISTTKLDTEMTMLFINTLEKYVKVKNPTIDITKK